MEIDKNLIREIAQYIDCGHDCYYNLKTKELFWVPNIEQLATGDEDYHREIFRDDLNKVKSQQKDLIKFEVLENYQSFKIMEYFKNQIVDERFRNSLQQALNKRKSFQNFKYIIDHSDYREDWFEFKQKELEKIVRKTIERHNSGI